MLGIWASHKEESSTSAGEAALGHVRKVPGQQLPVSGPPDGAPAPLAVIPAAKRTYAGRWPHQLWRGLLTSTCSKGGVGPPLVDNYAGPYLVLEKGPKFFKLQLGERTEEVSRDRLKPHVGQVPLAGRWASTQGAAPRENHKIFPTPEDSEDLWGV